MNRDCQLIFEAYLNKQPILFIVKYKFKGSFDSGEYLVCAYTKKEALEIVKAFYVGESITFSVCTLASLCKYLNEDPNEYIEGIEIPKVGKATSIEAGT